MQTHSWNNTHNLELTAMEQLSFLAHERNCLIEFLNIKQIAETLGVPEETKIQMLLKVVNSNLTKQS